MEVEFTDNFNRRDENPLRHWTDSHGSSDSMICDRLRAMLEATTTVKGHQRKLDTGKMVQVDQHQRKVDATQLQLPIPEQDPVSVKDIVKLTGPVVSNDTMYHHHATSLDNLASISLNGIRAHAPSYGTDQSAWPDGSVEKRIYFGTSKNIWQFAPEHGIPVALRIKKDAVKFKRESTGDFYATKRIRPDNLEVLTNRGWFPLKNFGFGTRLGEALQRVKAYARVRGGKKEFVRQHSREGKTARTMSIKGATPNEEKYIRKLLARHDKKVLSSASEIMVLNRKEFNALVLKSTGKRYDTRDVMAWYDEKKSFIAINRNNMVASAWKGVIDHELGHAAYYHSPKLGLWIKSHDSDEKFDRFTWYSKTAGYEAFAESYMAYIASGGKAKNLRYQRVFSVVKDVVGAVNPKINFARKMKW